MIPVIIAAAIIGALFFYGLGFGHGNVYRERQDRDYVEIHGRLPLAPRSLPPHPRHPAGRDFRDRGSISPLLIALLVGLSILLLSFTFGGPS